MRADERNRMEGKGRKRNIIEGKDGMAGRKEVKSMTAGGEEKSE